MNITLNPQQATLVQRHVVSGKFPSESAVIDKALQLLEEHTPGHEEWVKCLNEKIEEGIEDLRQGKAAPGEVVLQELRAYSRQRRQEMNAKP